MDNRTVNKLIGKFDKKQLQELILYIVSVNEPAKERLLDYCQKRESKTKTDNLAQILESKIKQYWAAKIYLENGEEQKFVESKKANLHYGSDYLELAAYYKKHDDKEAALKIVLEGLDKADGRLDEIYEYLFQYYESNENEAALEKLYAQSKKKNRDQDAITELMYQYYQKKGDYGKQKETLLKLVSCCDARELRKLYQKCRKELSNEDFDKEESVILNTIKKRNLSAYFDILMDKGEKKEVIEYIAKHQQYGGWGLDQGHYFSKRLSAEYPREVLDMYWIEVGFYVSLGKEKNYNHAVDVLKEIRTIMKRNKWTDEWNTKYNTFLEEHRRKKLLLKALDEASFQN